MGTLHPGLRGGAAVPGDGISATRTREVFDIPSGSGVLTTGRLTTSGAPWFVTGAGAGSTSVNSAGYIEGTGNTYCYLQASSRVQRVEQIFSGPLCTIAIAGNNDLQSLIHQNFSSGGSSAMTVFTAGVSSPAMWDKQIATVPNINDNLPHTCVLEMQGAMAFAYVDGILVGVSADARFLTTGGNWAYAQIHSGAGSRIYGFSLFTDGAARTDDSEPKIDVSQMRATSAAVLTLTVGNPISPGWRPIGTSYFHTDDNQGFTFDSNVETRLWVRSTQGGNRAVVNVVAAITNTVLGLRSNADGTADIQHQGANRIVFPFNTPQVSIPVRTFLGNVAAPGSNPIAGGFLFVEDGALKYRGSAGTVTTIAPA